MGFKISVRKRLRGLKRIFGQSAAEDAEAGEAIIEFILMTVILVLPLLFTISCLASIQAGLYAAQEAANTATRMASQGATVVQIERATEMIAQDFGSSKPRVFLECGACEVGDVISARVEITPRLPLVPAVGRLQDVVTVPVSVTSKSVIVVSGVGP